MIACSQSPVTDAAVAAAKPDQLSRESQALEDFIAHYETRSFKANSNTQVNIDILIRLLNIAEGYTPNYVEHLENVKNIATKVALVLGVGQGILKAIEIYAPFHDIGNVAIPRSLLKSEDVFDEIDRDALKVHPLFGARLFCDSNDQIDLIGHDLISTHHERWDGSGYPLGLKAGAIPIEGQIIAIADTYDALTSPRVYRKVRCNESALQEIRSSNKFSDAMSAALYTAVLEV